MHVSCVRCGWSGPRFLIHDCPNEVEDPPLDLISVRDFFAASALQGFLAAGSSGADAHYIMERCYLLADMMLRGRKPVGSK